MQIQNYQKELEKILKKVEDYKQECKPRLFLHSCCAPCSSYVLKYLRKYFTITVFYYNPNISEQEEYAKRVAEQKRLIEIYNEEEKSLPTISVVEGEHDTENFLRMAEPLADCREGGERCFLCYALRLNKTARLAKEGGYDYFGTTLTISPLKNAAKLNEIGHALEKELGIAWLPSDFKKKEGYKQSIELSAQYDLYRQDYCGCIYSKQEREREKLQKQETLARSGKNGYDG